MKIENIDTLTTAGKARVMHLAAEGRKVAKKADNDSVWIDCPEPVWNWPHFDYAIIAEPVGPDEVWVVVGIADENFTEEEAKEFAKLRGATAIRYVRAQE